MNKILKQILFWTSPGFILWLTLSIMNAQMYDQGLRDKLFQSESDTIMIPIYSFSLIMGVIIIAVTLLTFGLTVLTRKLSRQNATAITVSILILVGTGAFIAFEKEARKRNLEMISADLAVDLKPIARTLEYHFLWGFHLNEESCTVLWIPQTEFEQIQKDIANDSTWGAFSGETETAWKDCFKNASGFTFHAIKQVNDSIEMKMVVGFDPSRQLMIHAYSNHLLPRSDL